MKKIANIQATTRQKQVVKRIVDDSLSLPDAMRAVGYAQNTIINPKNVTESRGFQELMNAQGLTDDFLNSALKEDIERKPQNRVSELNLAYKLKGRLKESETGQQFTPATVNIAILKPDNKA